MEVTWSRQIDPMKLVVTEVFDDADLTRIFKVDDPDAALFTSLFGPNWPSLPEAKKIELVLRLLQMGRAAKLDVSVTLIDRGGS
jgi:hypothetical protein